MSISKGFQHFKQYCDKHPYVYTITHILIIFLEQFLEVKGLSQRLSTWGLTAHRVGASSGGPVLFTGPSHPALCGLSLQCSRGHGLSLFPSVRSTPAGAREPNALEFKQSKTEALCFCGITLQVQITCTRNPESLLLDRTERWPHSTLSSYKAGK